MPRRSNCSSRGGSPPVRRSSVPWRTKIGSVSMTSFSTRPGTPTTSLTRRTPCSSMPRWTHEVDAGRDGGHHEPRGDVLAGEQRQRAALHQRLAGAVGVDRAHPGQPGVEGEQQVEALLRAHLAHDHPGRAHPQRLLHEVAEPDLAGAFEPLLSGLERDPVGVGEPQLVDLLGADHPLAARDRGREAVQHRGLAGLGAAGDQDVEPGPHRRLEERRRARAEAAQLDQALQAVCADRELPDVHRGESAADPLQHDVQPVPLGQHRVDERLAQVDPPARALEHPLDQLLHLGAAQHQVGQLVPAVPGHEHPGRVVDPDLLHGRVVEERLQRAEPAHPRDQLADHGLGVGHRRHHAGQAALVVVTHHRLRDPAYDAGVGLRVHALAPHHLAHVRVEPLDQLVARRRGRTGMRRRHPDPEFPRRSPA